MYARGNIDLSESPKNPFSQGAAHVMHNVNKLAHIAYAGNGGIRSV